MFHFRDILLGRDFLNILYRKYHAIVCARAFLGMLFALYTARTHDFTSLHFSRKYRIFHQFTEISIIDNAMLSLTRRVPMHYLYHHDRLFKIRDADAVVKYIGFI